MFLLPEGKTGKAWEPSKSKALSETGSIGQKTTFAWAKRVKGAKTLKTAQVRLLT
jgi:hypothetical protein